MDTLSLQARIFCNVVAQDRKVWTLRKDGRFVKAENPISGIKGMPFWSSLAKAQKAILDLPVYKEFLPVEINWQNFVDEWVPRLTKEEVPVGFWGGFKAVGSTLEAAALVDAVEDEAEYSTIIRRIQYQFDLLDRNVVGPANARITPMKKIPKLNRDLYLVHDVVAITCNAGMGAWIYYREANRQSSEIGLAVEAFRRIGYPEAAEGLQGTHKIYLKKKDKMTLKDDEKGSSYVINHERDIIRSLHSYLVANNYPFASSERAKRVLKS